MFCFFFHVVLLISLRHNATKFISAGSCYKDVILFSKIFYVFDVVYVKPNRISCEFSGSEHHGNAVKKANGTLTLSKLKVDALTVQRIALVFPRCHTFEILNLNNSLNIKIRTKLVRTFWFLMT